MVTLDDVIERLKYDREIDMDINELAPQIAEWLEELKAIREYVEPLKNFNTHNLYLPLNSVLSVKILSEKVFFD